MKRIVSKARSPTDQKQTISNPTQKNHHQEITQGRRQQSLLDISSVGGLVSRLIERLVVLVVDGSRSLVVMVVMIVREEAVVVFVLVVLVGVTREVLLLVRTDQVLGLVKQRLVGGAGGSGTGVGVLLARDLVGGGLGGRLVGVGDDVTMRRVGQKSVGG